MATVFLNWGEGMGHWCADKAREGAPPFSPAATVALVIGLSAVTWLIIWGALALIF